jgi:NAD(P)-dependent dehydrogenase (short-subunit alcohol dehydrogenase family)|tara:strand:- start:327 stop:1115 length:789 start_codon:yes stop_codon:yes gene_type:complete
MALLNLKNKKIVISAGASGIGWAAAKIFLSKGANVYLCDIDTKNINKIKKHPLNNKRLFIYECNASEEYDVENFFDKIKKKTKKIDALINNVGVAGPTGTIEKLNSEDWEKTLKVNVISHFYFTKLAIPMLKKNKGGSIINVSSGAGIMGFPLRSPYAASKWAVVGMTKTLAMELGKFKIRVNAICPGTIKGNRMIRVIKDKANFLKISKKKIEKEFVSMSSMNCWVYEEDIGKMCSFLISDDAIRISGQVIGVDGNAIRLD